MSISTNYLLPQSFEEMFKNLEPFFNNVFGEQKRYTVLENARLHEYLFNSLNCSSGTEYYWNIYQKINSG